jgi:CheY-like chemotaxis protein
MKGRSLVLLVDDNDAGQMLVRVLLNSAGLRVDSSGSVVKAADRTTKTASSALDSKRTDRRP